MAAPKRKADAGAATPKKETGDRSAKRQRKSDVGAAPAEKKAAASPIAKVQNVPPKSVFTTSEKAFPRGGASVLTPLEHKQIQIKATQDVLFEAAGGKKKPADDDEFSAAGSDVEMEDAPKTKKRKSKKDKKGKKEEEETAIRVESLSYKRLAQGTIVLGQVTEITSRDLVLALPNSLVGFVPLTAISDKMNVRIEKLVADQEKSDDEDNEEEDDEFEDVDLENMFQVGQYLRACVTSTAEEGASHKKRIELSIEPSLTNRGITKSSVVTNGTIQASVISNEDHGLIMEMGLEESGLKGFLPKSELPKSVEHSKVQEGAVFLCTVSRLNPDGRIVTLSADHEKAGNLKKLAYVSDAPTIDVFLPGTAVDLLVTDTTATTITGKIMGMLDATADIIHSGAANKGEDMSEKYKIASKVKARVLFTVPGADPKKVGVSLLDHIVSLSPRQMTGKQKDRQNPIDKLPISSFVEEAKVTRVEPRAGLYLDVGVKGVPGFAHISRISDEKIERLETESGPYKVGSTHRARVVGFNTMDGLFQVSLEPKVLAQTFLRIQDVPVGAVVQGTIEKLIIDKKGHTSVLVKISEGIVGLVSETHLSDVRLQHPERKFREGAKVSARVLSVDTEKRQMKLTFKKSLLNSDVEPWVDYATINVGDKSPGTIVDVKPSGARVRFYGDVAGWLPAAEMSEAYIEDATRHFQKGQVVTVRVVSIDLDRERMIVSCKDPQAADAGKEAAFKSINPGDIVKGTVIEKTAELATVDLGQGVKGLLRVGQLTDGSEKKDKATMARVRVGGPLEDLVVLDKHNKTRSVVLSNKPSLRKDAQAKKLITRVEDIRVGQTVHGFVRALAGDKVFVELGGGVSGLLFQSQMEDDMKNAPDFGLRKDQSITARASHVDASGTRFWLSMKADAETPAKATTKVAGEATVNAVDQNIKSTTDLAFGSSTTVRVKSIKDTQLNVQVADNVQGRISIAEIFNGWDDIKDKKRPLSQFKMNDIIPVKVLGMHDARNHRFLPISHRQGKVPTFELTAKDVELKSDTDVLTLDKVTEGSSYIAFINNIADRFVWVNISANVRGRISLFDLSDDISLLGDVEKNFPVGSAIKVRVKSVDAAAGRLDLTATSTDSAKNVQLKDLKAGLVLPSRVTKVHESSIVVQINENIAAPIYLEQLADDYAKANPKNFKPNDIVRVCVLDVDVPNKRLTLSARPSRVLSSSLPIKDPEINSISDLKVHQVVRGFVKRIDPKGLFVRLGPHVDAFVKISNLSDEYIKDWKSAFQVDQLVEGKIIAANKDMKSAQMTLKRSVVEGTYVPTLQFSDMEVGQVVTARVRKVQDYGVFLVVDNSNNVSGLCHISQIADSRVEDLKSLYKEGDAVKAKILEIDQEKRRISFGLKYSLVSGEGAGEGSEDESGDAEDEEMSDVSDMDDEDEDIDMRSVKSDGEDESEEEADETLDYEEIEDPIKNASLAAGLATSGFDWTGATLDFNDSKAAADDSSDDEPTKKKKKHKKATIQEDRTGDLDAQGPQSVADYERLLLGQPNSAELWVRYMVFQRELNEIEKARQIAKRALSVINPREEKARLDVWTALLHLENSFGSDDQLEETFKDACQHNDSREMHERMIKIYISHGKLDKADTLYQSMTKNKSFTPTPSLWLSYATFLMSTLNPPSPSRARALLPRATQSVPESEHRYLTTKFAALEFKSPNGDPERGRTIFEGLISMYPKKGDLWDMYVDLERSHGGEDNVRALYERMCKGKMKKKRGERVFRKWAEWEESLGNEKAAKQVRAAEKEWRELREKEGDAEE